MLQIGRKIYYDETTGKILADTGERAGDVRETTRKEDIQTFALPANVGFISFAYGERRGEFMNIGSYEVNLPSGAVVIYPRLSASLDKPSILSDGVDKAIVTVQTANMVADMITFTVSDTPQVIPTDAAGKAVFALSSTLPGEYTVLITSGKYGSDSVKVGVV